MPSGKPGSRTECTIDGCVNIAHAKGYCNKHYLRNKINGSPNNVAFLRISGTLEERFWARVERTEDCWIWRGCKRPDGYGQFRDVNRKPMLAHRLSYQLAIGEIPKELVIDHRCHTRDCKGGVTCPHRSCVKPAHLVPTTFADNVKRGQAGHMLKGCHWTKKKYCKRNHRFTGDNTYVTKDGERICRQCKKMHELTRRARIREARLATGEIITMGPKPKSHCKYGHPFDEQNTYIHIWRGNRMRSCKTCNRIKTQRHRASKLKEARL